MIPEVRNQRHLRVQGSGFRVQKKENIEQKTSNEFPVHHSSFIIHHFIYVFFLIGTALVQAQNVPGNPLKDTGFDQKLNEQVPLTLAFKDENGQAVILGDYFDEKPIMLILGYYECPMLCGMVLNGITESLRRLNEFSVGKEFNLLFVSIDPDESPELAASLKKTYVNKYGREGASRGWHFLTGSSSSIQRLSSSIGFRYVYDEVLDQYAHPAGLTLLTPKGKVARYFFGIDYPPRDLRLGLVEAANNKIGSPIDQLLLLCYGYNPATGKYSLLIFKIIRFSGIMTVVLLGIFLFLMFRKENASKPVTA